MVGRGNGGIRELSKESEGYRGISGIAPVLGVAMSYRVWSRNEFARDPGEASLERRIGGGEIRAGGMARDPVCHSAFTLISSGSLQSQF